MGKGILGTGLRRPPLDILLKHELRDELISQVDQWLVEFTAAVASQIEPHPQPTLLMEPAQPVAVQEAPSGSVLSTRPGGVVWVPVGDTGGAYLDTEQPQRDGTGLVPVTADTWLRLSASGRVNGLQSSDLCRAGTLLQALDEFHGLALTAEQLNCSLSLADELNEQTERAAFRRRDEELARAGLFSVLSARRHTPDTVGSPLLAALQAIGEHESLEVKNPTRSTGSSEEPTLQNVLSASAVRARQVRLTLEDNWWVGDSGAMLGFLRDGGRPVALLPGFQERYRVLDPSSRRSSHLNAARARELAPDAWRLYAPLPEDEPVAAQHMLRLAAAAWDRLLGLRSGFFRNFTAGELAVRMLVFQAMREQLSGVVANALLSLAFLFPTLAILFHYDTTLVLINLGMAFDVVCVTAVFGLLQLAPLRRHYEVSRHLAGELLQFINGMSKLRSAGAEVSAFAAWARRYREQHLSGIQIARYSEHLVAFSAAMPALVGAALFAGSLARGSDRISVGDFLVVYALSMTFYTAGPTASTYSLPDALCNTAPSKSSVPRKASFASWSSVN